MLSQRETAIREWVRPGYPEMNSRRVAMKTEHSLSAALVDAPMSHYFRRKFADLPDDELACRIEETLRFLFISH